MPGGLSSSFVAGAFRSPAFADKLIDLGQKALNKRLEQISDDQHNWTELLRVTLEQIVELAIVSDDLRFLLRFMYNGTNNARMECNSTVSFSGLALALSNNKQQQFQALVFEVENACVASIDHILKEDHSTNYDEQYSGKMEREIERRHWEAEQMNNFGTALPQRIGKKIIQRKARMRRKDAPWKINN